MSKNHKRVIAIRGRGPLPWSTSMGQRHWRDYVRRMVDLLGLLTLADAGEWEYMMMGTRYCKSLLHLIFVVRSRRSHTSREEGSFPEKRPRFSLLFPFFLDVSAHA